MPLQRKRGRTADRDRGANSRGANSRKAKDAGIAVAIIGAIAVICAAGLTSGAYAKVCPAILCGDGDARRGGEKAALPATPTPSSPTPGHAAGAPAAGQNGAPPHYQGSGVSTPGGSSTGAPAQAAGTSPTPARPSPAKPIGDFSVALLEDYGCTLRTGQDGNWDINIWYTVNWVSASNHPMPSGRLRVVSDLDRTKDWSFSLIGQPGNYLDTFVESDNRYLGRFVTVTAKVHTDSRVPETSTANNTLALRVDLRGGLPPAGTNQKVPCTKA
ncbi:hypothetical protein WEI85_30575 [Actinomycetes bacterium KLBMP 9797]